MTKEIQKLELKNGDVLIVKGFNENDEQQDFIQSLADNIEPGTLSRCCIIFLEPGQKIEKVDPVQMEKAGWVRKGLS